jgi:hypothetical protein
MCVKSSSMGRAQIVFDTFGPMIQQCVLNQTLGYWLLLDALIATIALVC